MGNIVFLSPSYSPSSHIVTWRKLIILYIKIIICVCHILDRLLHTIECSAVKFWHVVGSYVKCIVLESAPPAIDRSPLARDYVHHWFNISAGKIGGVKKPNNTAPILGWLLGNGGSQRHAVNTIRRRRECPGVWCAVCICAHATCRLAAPFVGKWPC